MVGRAFPFINGEFMSFGLLDLLLCCYHFPTKSKATIIGKKLLPPPHTSFSLFSLYPFLSSLPSPITVSNHKLGQRLVTPESRHQGKIVLPLVTEREKPDCEEKAALVAGEKSLWSLQPSIARFVKNHHGLSILRSNCNKLPPSPLLLSSAQHFSDQRGKREKPEERKGKKKAMERGRESRMGREKGTIAANHHFLPGSPPRRIREGEELPEVAARSPAFDSWGRLI
ncbi:hypothetical protein TIFTF001_014128 [Ficus carica]|uniref:Uncharacterized protein n=1 Tax=Ficus carica TaxID=3494 RepID=A0AA88AQU8_FICCA|nr:hypothetical protein TIFTF001_014128 [Ficus carica]